MIEFQSTGIFPDGNAEHGDLAAHDQMFVICSKADGAPDISRPMSKPSRMPSRSITGRQILARHIDGHGVGNLVAQVEAVVVDVGDNEWRAPTWRQTAAAMMPMGPAPVISTSSPTRSKERAV